MDKTFDVQVNDSQKFSFNPEEIEALDLVREPGNEFHVLDQNQAYRARLVSSNFDDKSYVININSTNYHIKIGTHLDRLIKEMGFTIGSSKVVNSIKAPMPGIIIGIEAEAGQEVKEGDTLLILEAMKMENAILCPKDTVIKSVEVAVGDTVEKNKLLIELE